MCTQDMCYFFPVSADCLWKCTTKGSCKWHTSKSYSLQALESHVPCLGGHRSPSSLTGQSLTILVTMRSLNCSPLTLYRRIRSKKKKKESTGKANRKEEKEQMAKASAHVPAPWVFRKEQYPEWEKNLISPLPKSWCHIRLLKMICYQDRPHS